jgi:hypothetical protein
MSPFNLRSTSHNTLNGGRGGLEKEGTKQEMSERRRMDTLKGGMRNRRSETQEQGLAAQRKERRQKEGGMGNDCLTSAKL